MKINIKQIFVLVLALICAYFSLVFFVSLNIKDIGPYEISDDILLRRKYLINYLSQYPFPEDQFISKKLNNSGRWTFETYAYATYALTNIAMIQTDLCSETSLIIADWIERCQKEDIFYFDKHAWNESPLEEQALNGDEGHAKYYGHLNLMIGCYALMNNDGRFDVLHKKLCEAIARRINKYPHRQIESYWKYTFPVDNTIAVASLKIADMSLGTDYSDLIQEWLRKTKHLETDPYRLIAHQIDSQTGAPTVPARGNGSAKNSFFLPLIDENYAQVQFSRLKESLLFRFFSFAAIREYSQGNVFRGDEDSGPIIFGLGSTATAYSIAGARRNNNYNLVTNLLRSIELAGCSITKNKQKRYLATPVLGDAIILAMRTACEWRPVWY